MEYKNLVTKFGFGIGLTQMVSSLGLALYVVTNPIGMELTKQSNDEFKLERILDDKMSIREYLSLSPEKMKQYTKVKEEYMELVKRREFLNSQYGKKSIDNIKTLQGLILWLLATGAFTMLGSSIFWKNPPKSSEER